MFSVLTDSVSDRECQITSQKGLHKKDLFADNEDPIAGNYRGCKKAVHQFGTLKPSVSRYLYRFPFRNRKNVQLYNVSASSLSYLFVKKYLLVVGSGARFSKAPETFPTVKPFLVDLYLKTYV